MRSVRTAGVDIAYRRSGRGTPLLLLHGAFGDSRDWTHVQAGLAEHADVVAWDAPGCGASSDVPSDWTDADWANAIAGFIDAVGLERPVICGLSLGSVFALLAARDHPASMRALVLAGPYAGWAGSLGPDEVERRVAAAEATMATPVAEWADAFLSSVYPTGTDQGRIADARSALLAWRPSTTAAILEIARLDLRDTLPGITVPTLVVRGSDDERSPVAAAAAIVATVRDARFVELPGLGHDCIGPAFADAVIDFMNGLERTR